MDVGWDITSKDVEKLRQFLTPTIHTLPNFEPVVQPYIPLGPVHDMDKVVKEKEHDDDIPLNNNVMQPLTPQTVYITPSGDDYVAPATNPISNKQLNKFEEKFSNITKVAKKEYDNHVMKTYDCETFIRKLPHQDPAARRHLSRPARPIIILVTLLNLQQLWRNEFSLHRNHYRPPSGLKGLLHMLNATVIPMKGIKSLQEDGNNLKIFVKFQISKQCSGSFLS
ncbi:hypothetical protein Tco_0646723 [Tanacetum coccineum]